MPYRLQKRISMQNVPNFTLYLVALNILWALLIPQSTILFFEMLQRTQQKETPMIVAHLEIVFHLKIKWRLMRSGSSIKRDLSHKIGPLLQPVFMSNKLGQGLKPKEIKSSIVNKQCVVYHFV